MTSQERFFSALADRKIYTSVNFRVLLFIVLLTTCLQGNAQTFDTSGIGNRSSSAIIKLYDVATRVSINSVEKEALLNLFEEEEQQRRTFILNGAPSSVLDSLEQVYKGIFNTLLPATVIDEYYSKKAGTKAATIADLTAQMLQSKFNLDSTLTGYFRNMYNWREGLIEKQWLSSANNDVRNSNLLKIIVAYDTLISKYINASAGGRYFNNKIYLLDSLTSVDSLRKATLRAKYYDGCMKYRNRSYADNFRIAFAETFSASSDTGYYFAAYGNEVLEKTLSSSEATLAYYVKQHQLSAYTSEKLAPLIGQKERALVLVNMAIPRFSASKDSIIDNILSVYQPRIDSLIAAEGKLFSASQLEIAIKYAAELELNNAQVEELIAALEQLNRNIDDYRQEDPVGEYDSKAFESETLNRLLLADQYTQVLSYKYQGIAINMAKMDWQELIRYEIAVEYDSATVHTELTNYHLAILIAYYRNAFNPEEQYLAVRRIQDVMPDVYRRLLEFWEYRTPYSNTPDVFFQW